MTVHLHHITQEVSLMLHYSIQYFYCVAYVPHWWGQPVIRLLQDFHPVLFQLFLNSERHLQHHGSVPLVLNSDTSCQNTVNSHTVERVFNGLKPCSTQTGGYCKARQRLPLDMIMCLAKQTGIRPCEISFKHSLQLWLCGSDKLRIMMIRRFFLC